MKIRHLILAAGIVSCLGMTAQNNSGLDNPMTKAVLRVYEEQLAANPQDYQTYFERATTYYRHNEYEKALDDINNAIKYTPASKKDDLKESYSMRANIYEMTKRYADAVSDLDQVLKLDPKSFLAYYQRGNLNYRLGNIDAAKADYERMLRENPRSQEAMVGLARVAAKEGNATEANNIIDGAVALTPSSSSIYQRRANIRRMLGNNVGATQDLIRVLSIDNVNNRALKDLVDISKEDYAAVSSGIESAIQQNPRIGSYYYIRAMIAKSQNKYNDAIADFKRIVDEHLFEYHGIYGSLAECYLAQCNFADASTYCNKAIFATTEKENAPYYVLKGKIGRAQNFGEYALSDVQKALTNDKDYAPALIESALILVDAKRYSEADAVLSQVIANDNRNPYYYALKGWINNRFLNNSDVATAAYNRIIELSDNAPKPIARSLRGFALVNLGRHVEATDWIQQVLANAASDGSDNYYAACLYGQMGDLDNAFVQMERALKSGYANLYDWKIVNDADINVAPLRKDPRFEQLLKRYSSLF